MPPQKSSNTPCHISDKIRLWETARDIRASICRDLETSEHTDGKHYCLLHLPTKEKDGEKFETIRKARFAEVEAAVSKLEEFPEEEREAKLSEISYDFRYVRFPSSINLTGHRFTANANFRSAVFSGYANFRLAAFSDYANFGAAVFSGDAYFTLAAFSGYADFKSATFSSGAYFKSADFQKIGNFENTTFFSDVDFHKTEFLETSEIFFKRTRFCSNVKFGQAMFEGFVSFEGNADEKIFPDRNIVGKVRAELKARFDGLKQHGKEAMSYEKLRLGNKEAILDLQSARLKKPERIMFHTARLRPNWFVNTDARKMVFTDCRWENIDQTSIKDRLNGKNRKQLNANINTELQALTDRRIPEEKRLLEIACRQLAVNAEENNRYEDASKFRYMAMETKRLEYPWHGRFYTLSWWYRLSSGYGESWGRAALILLGIWLAFAWAYTGLTFYVTPLQPAPIGFVRWEKKAQSAEESANPAFAEDTEGERFVAGKALWYSGAVMALQRPEPKPATNWTRGLIILETILGPLQAALLALAIRRKFMR